MARKAFVGALMLLCFVQQGLAADQCDVLLSRGSGSFRWMWNNSPCRQMTYTIPASESKSFGLTFTLTERYCSYPGQIKSSIAADGSDFKWNYSTTGFNGVSLSAPPGHAVRLHVIPRIDCGSDSFSGVYRQGAIIGSWKKFLRKENDLEPERCANGGRHEATTGQCVCPPGFIGPTCLQACGWDKFGDSCELSCTGDSGQESNGCRGIEICHFEECACAAGFEGPNCDSVCAFGKYGFNCAQQCGMCSNGGNCDPTTGHCLGGCQPGYFPPFCQEKLTHLRSAPDIYEIGSTYLKGSFPATGRGTQGRGSIVFYQPQCKVKSDLDDGWVPSSLERYSPDDQLGLYNFTIINLPPDTDLIVRVLLVDYEMRSFDNPPTVSVRTTGRNRVENLKVSNVSARSADLTWDSYDFKQGEYFFVRRKCVSLLACPGPCPHSESILVAANTSMALEELLPAATYRVTVQAAENHQEMVVFTTDLLPPDATVSSLRLSARTNNSAMLEWRPSAQCDSLFGPTSLYEWSLKPLSGSAASAFSNTTTATATMLTGLEALSDYQFSVNLINPEGPAQRMATLNFSTYHTVPDPPRDLVAYRQNRSAVWLRWREPARPSGALREYVVETVMLKGSPSRGGPGAPRTDRLPAASRCAAWPDQVCFTVARLRPQARYAVTVRAVNEHGTKPGEPSTIEATTVKGVSEPPQDLRTVEVHSDSALIAWRLPAKINGDLQFFEVSVVRHVRADETSAETDVPDPDLEKIDETKEKPQYEWRVEGLQPGATYSITVNCGRGGQAAHLEVTTRLVPEEPPASGLSPGGTKNSTLYTGV